MHHRGREQPRRRPPPAAETGSGRRGSGRRGQAPSQGAPADAGTATRKIAPQCRNQQSCGLLVSPRESPRGMGKSAERAGGRDAPATQPYGKRRALFYCYNPERRAGAEGDKNRCEGDNGKPKQGWWSTGKILLCPGTQYDFILYLEFGIYKDSAKRWPEKRKPILPTADCGA
mgnify:CR=1 FL=1